jgi:CRP-like cAMP-binding protein
MSDVDIQERYIALLRKSGDPEEHPAGEVVFSAGDPADRMYVVTDGTVALSLGDSVLEVVGPGGLFGEMAVIDREPRSATAVVETDATSHARRPPSSRPTRRSSRSTSAASGSSCRRRPTLPRS